MAAWAVASLLLLAPGLEADVARALDKAKIKRSGLSVVVGRAGGPPAFTLASVAARVPASNQKILTASAALEKLGRDFRFRTVVAREGEDLVVIGDGDPNLSGRFFEGQPNLALLRLAADVKRQGVERIRHLVLDASRFDDAYVHPDWPKDQLERWYCAPVAALVFNDSCWDVTVGPGPAPGAPARVSVEPSLLQPTIANRCTTVRKGAKTAIHIGRDQNGGLLVRGSTNYVFTGQVAVREPVGFFGEAFLAALKTEGVEVTGGLRSGKLPGAKPVVVYRSTLRRTLPVLLQNSQNLYAECLFKRIGDGSFEGGARAVLDALKAMGVSTANVEPKDGSGLAHTNRVTALALYQCLQKLRDEALFVDALATGGTGTLRRRYRSLGERIRAKTGSIRGVSSLSGYVTGASGRRYVFVVLANGPSIAHARKAQDLIVKALADG